MTEDLKFIQVGDLAKGITENILPDSSDLAGTSLDLFFEDGCVTNFHFNTVHSLTRVIRQEAETGRRTEATYRATCPREGIYFVDYIDPSTRATSVSMVIDRNSQSATTVFGTLPTEAETCKDAFSRVREELELTAVTAQFRKASIGRPFASASHPHTPTDELVGKRIKYVYSKTEAYEHIYLTPKLYTWHCLEGIEKGLADTDRCHYYKIAEALYLFVWREKIVPTLGVVMVDLERMKTTGKLFGYEGDDFGMLTNAPVGAYAKLLNVTSYE
jgi:MoaF C-terminal domain/MoaF N-terminal domain